MPDHEEDEFDRVIAAPPEPEDEEAAFDAQLSGNGIDTAAEFDKQLALEPAAPEAPESAPVFKEKAIGDEPWYTILGDSAANTPAATALENVASGALSNTTDEIGAAAISPKYDPRDAAKFGTPAADPNDYAAGSQFEDTRKTLEAEKAERDAQNPASATVGQVVGGGLQAVALPAAATQTALGAGLAGAGMTAANYMGQGSGDLGDRAGQAAEMAEEHPLATVAGVALPAVAGGSAGAAAKAAPELADASSINRAAAIMTPGQRATYAANKGGKDGLVRLGQDIEGSKLHLRNPESPSWYPSNWLPASSENMYDNAVALKANAGKRLGTAEGEIAAANPPVQVGNISQDLRKGADDLADMWDPASANTEADYRKLLAQRVDDSTIAHKPAPGAEGPSSPVTGELPFTKAVAQRRDLDKNTNFNQAGGVENAGMKDQVRRQTGTALRRNIGSGLDAAAAADPNLAQPVADWRKANKDFSLASTVEDPALQAMQKEYGGNLGLRDMATATAAQAMGIPGPLAMAAGKLAKGGRGANALAGTQKTLSKAFGAFGANAGPAVLASTQAALPDPEVAKEKNEDLKSQIADMGQRSWNWVSQLLK